MKPSGSIVRASSARTTIGRLRKSSASLRRCSIRARAKRFLEAPRRQHDLDRLAAADLAADVGRFEPKLDALPGPGMLADFEKRRRIDLFGAGPGNFESQFRRPFERQARTGQRRRPRPGFRRIARLRLAAAAPSPGTGEAVIVLGLIGDPHRAAWRAADVFRQRDLGQRVGDHVERPLPEFSSNRTAPGCARICEFRNGLPRRWRYRRV